MKYLQRRLKENKELGINSHWILTNMLELAEAYQEEAKRNHIFTSISLIQSRDLKKTGRWLCKSTLHLIYLQTKKTFFVAKILYVSIQFCSFK